MKTIRSYIMDRYSVTKKIALLGIVSNVFLLIIKLCIGLVSHSQAMIADGFNSAGDVFASVMTYVGNKIASQPEDENHPFGHGKAEYIFSMIISFSLILVAFKIFQNSLNSIINREEFFYSVWLVSTAVITILLKLALFFYTRKIGSKHNNLLVLANSEDHRNDVFVTTSTLLGIITGNMGMYWIDGVVGIGISLWIFYTGIKVFAGSYKVLMDTNINEEFKNDVMDMIKSIDGVDHIDDVSAKPVGVRYILIVKVSVNGNMTVWESHQIAGIIRRNLKKCKNVADVVVHINPA